MLRFTNKIIRARELEEFPPSILRDCTVTGRPRDTLRRLWFDRCDLSALTLRKGAHECVFSECGFANHGIYATWDSARFHKCGFRACDLSPISARRLEFEWSDFFDCNLQFTHGPRTCLYTMCDLVFCEMPPLTSRKECKPDAQGHERCQYWWDGHRARGKATWWEPRSLEQDWHPDEFVPEDYYANSRRVEGLPGPGGQDQFFEVVVKEPGMPFVDSYERVRGVSKFYIAVRKTGWDPYNCDRFHAGDRYEPIDGRMHLVSAYVFPPRS